MTKVAHKVTYLATPRCPKCGKRTTRWTSQEGEKSYYCESHGWVNIPEPIFTRNARPIQPHEIRPGTILGIDGRPASGSTYVFSVSPSRKQVVVGSRSNTAGSKFAGRRYTFRFDGTGYKRQGQYLTIDEPTTINRPGSGPAPGYAIPKEVA